jgi:hypothetical protein
MSVSLPAICCCRAIRVVVPLPPKGSLLDDYIERRWEALSPVQCNLPEWVPTRAVWLPILHNERELELTRYFARATSTPCSASTATAPRATLRLARIVLHRRH